jgi:hypothetical protein
MSEKEKYDFRYENSINFSKVYVPTDGEHKYSAWRTNSVLSNFPDTVMHANEMNMNASLPDRLQYEYLLNVIRPRKRFFKKNKVKKDDHFSIVQEYYKYNNERTREALKILTEEQINKIKEKLEKGGTK